MEKSEKGHVSICDKCGKEYRVIGVSLEGNICPECLEKEFGRKDQGSDVEQREKHVEKYWKYGKKEKKE